MYSGRKTVEIVTPEKVTMIEGDTVVTYTVTNVSEERQEEVAEAAAAFMRFLIESSAFSSSEYTDNNYMPTDY